MGVARLVFVAAAALVSSETPGRPSCDEQYRANVCPNVCTSTLAEQCAAGARSLTSRERAGGGFADARAPDTFRGSERKRPPTGRRRRRLVVRAVDAGLVGPYCYGRRLVAGEGRRPRGAPVEALRRRAPRVGAAFGRGRRTPVPMMFSSPVRYKTLFFVIPSSSLAGFLVSSRRRLRRRAERTQV